MNDERQHLRETFNQSADLYDRARPGYPDALVDDVITLSEIPKQGRTLEIGCATGKATELFASRGYSMDRLDIGNHLAAVAARKLREFDNVQFAVTSFEEWESNRQVYDLIIAATSFHWVDPAAAYAKSAAILKSTGSLAVFSNTHVGQNEGFFARVQDVYNACAHSMMRADPDGRKRSQKPAGAECFQKPITRRYPWSVEYTANQYVDLLGTYSDHISLPEAEKRALFTGIANLIDQEYGGKVLKHYEAVLTLRRKKQ